MNIIMKTKTKKKSVKKSVKKSARAKLMAKKKVSKKKVITKPEEQEYYQVAIEMKRIDPQGKVLEYYYQPYTQQEVDRVVADEKVAELKALGQGGRIILLDGTPNGKVIETWPSTTRALELAAIENKELDKKSAPSPMVPSWVQ